MQAAVLEVVLDVVAELVHVVGPLCGTLPSREGALVVQRALVNENDKLRRTRSHGEEAADNCACSDACLSQMLHVHAWKHDAHANAQPAHSNATTYACERPSGIKWPLKMRVRTDKRDKVTAKARNSENAT